MEAGPQPINLLVNSTVLCLVSPVFSRPLQRTHGEGVAFGPPTPPVLFPLSLPEDSGSAFTVIANIFHRRSSERYPICLSTTALLDIAALSDKYDLSAALRPHAILWIQRALGSGPFHPDYDHPVG